MRTLTGLQQALKSLRRDPWHSLSVIGILALGIATTVAVYSIVAGVVLRPLPYESPEDLVVIRQYSEREGLEYAASGPSVRDWQESSRTLESLAATTDAGPAIVQVGAEAPTRAVRTQTTPELFQVLGARPAVGRLLIPSDGDADAPRVAVLSHAYWRDRWGGDPAAVGRTIRIADQPYEVVGVAAPEVNLPRDTEIWTVFPPDAAAFQIRYAHILSAYARLAPGVAPAAAQSELNTILAAVPGYDFTARVIPLKDRLVGDVRTPLLILLGAVALVLLIASANVSSLVLARLARRRRELAVRGALGGDRRWLITQLLAESAVLALSAGALGVLLAAWLLDALIALAPGDLPRVEEIGIDLGVLAFALVTSLVTGLLTGAAPAFRLRRGASVRALREGDGRTTGRTRGLRAAFVVAEVALSVALLFGAGLLVRSFTRIVSIDPGFRSEQVTTFGISLPGQRYDEPARVRAYGEQLLEQVRALPGVSGAALSQNLPVSGGNMVTPAVLENREVENPPRVQIETVSDGYFEVLGVPVVEGRGFTTADAEGAPPVAVVNEAFVRAYFDGDNPIGRRAHTFFPPQIMREIVGVVGTTAHGSLTEDREPKFYYPAAQMPPAGFRLVVRSDAPTESLIPAVRAVVARIDPAVPLGEVATMRELLARTTAGPRFYATTLTVFAALALLLAVTGFFAVLSQAVTRRRREMGVRLAVGAAPGQILRQVVGEGLALTALGLGVGVAAALASGRLLRGLLYGVGPADPLVLAAVVALLAAVATLAAWLPARRAASTDPMQTLRTE